VLAIGLLGLAGLQMTALRFNHSAYLRSQATMLAADIADRIRVNSVAREAGSYNSGTATQATACNTTSGCSTSALAGNDLYEWDQQLAAMLPGGEGIVCLDTSPKDGTDKTSAACSGSGSVYAIKIWWTDDRSGTKQQFVTTFQP
jgi:type IV pilus assembly protein PilV